MHHSHKEHLSDCLKEKKHCCAHIQSNWRHENHRRTVAWGWASVSHIIQVPWKKEKRGGKGRKTTYWLENCMRNKKYYNHFLPIHHVTNIIALPFSMSAERNKYSYVRPLFKYSSFPTISYLLLYTNKRDKHKFGTWYIGTSLQLVSIPCPVSPNLPDRNSNWRKYQMCWLHWQMENIPADFRAPYYMREATAADDNKEKRTWKKPFENNRKTPGHLQIVIWLGPCLHYM